MPAPRSPAAGVFTGSHSRGHAGDTLGNVAPLPRHSPPEHPPRDHGTRRFTGVLTSLPSPSHLPKVFFSSCVVGKAAAEASQPQGLHREGVRYRSAAERWVGAASPTSRSTTAATPSRPPPAPSILPSQWQRPIPTFPGWTDPHPSPGTANVKLKRKSFL